MIVAPKSILCCCELVKSCFSIFSKSQFRLCTREAAPLSLSLKTLTVTLYAIFPFQFPIVYDDECVLKLLFRISIIEWAGSECNRENDRKKNFARK